MEKLFALNIITPERTVFGGKVSSLIAPGELGYLGVLSNHAPFLTTLVSGKIVYKEESGNNHSFQLVGNGFLEVLNNQATLIVDKIESLN